MTSLDFARGRRDAGSIGRGSCSIGNAVPATECWIMSRARRPPRRRAEREPAGMVQDHLEHEEAQDARLVLQIDSGLTGHAGIPPCVAEARAVGGRVERDAMNQQARPAAMEEQMRRLVDDVPLLFHRLGDEPETEAIGLGSRDGRLERQRDTVAECRQVPHLLRRHVRPFHRRGTLRILGLHGAAIRSNNGGPGTIPRRWVSTSRRRSATTSGCAAATSCRSPGSAARSNSSGGVCSRRSPYCA